MPYVLRPNQLYAKNPNGSGYLAQNVVASQTTAEMLADIQAEGQAQVSAVASEGTTQVSSVNSAGATQIAAIQAAATDLQSTIDSADDTIASIDALDDIITGLRNLIDLVHPVGSIFISRSNTRTPDQMFGGTWAPIEDRFLLTAGTYYHVGDPDGGEATHTLTESELPEMHKKMVFRRIYGTERADGSGRNEYAIHIATGSEGVTNEIVDANVSGPIVTNGTYNPGRTQRVSINIGGDEAHNNMPPYTIVYAWERIA